jgi:hypothetical protein
VDRVALDDFNSIPSGQAPGAKRSIEAKHPPVRAGTPETSENPTPSSDPASLSGKASRMGTPRTIRDTPPLALEPDILGHFAADLRLAGVAGEERLAKLTYLALTSRVLPWGRATNRPVSVIAKGTSSTGKSHTTQTVLRFFPRSAYLDLGSMSRRYLFYSDENLAHRFIVVAEASGIAGDDEVLTALRTLLSEGRIVHGTVEGEGKKAARRIEKEGPTGLLMTTTLAAVDHEMETRCLSLVTDDSPEQTRRVFATLAGLEDEDECPVPFENWHELQEWIADGDNRVGIPYVTTLAKLMPDSAARLRRDFVSLLCLLRAHAILHQASRDRDERGRIVATLGDYAAIRDLCSALVAEGADAGVPNAVRETVEATRNLLETGLEFAGPKTIADKLGIGLPATYDRLRRARHSGYVVDIASNQERRMKIILGAPLPDEPEFLPTVEAVGSLFGSFSDKQSEAAIAVSIPDREAISDSRTTKTTPEGDVTSEEVERLAELIRGFAKHPDSSAVPDAPSRSQDTPAASNRSSVQTATQVPVKEPPIAGSNTVEL